MLLMGWARGVGSHEKSRGTNPPPTAGSLIPSGSLKVPSEEVADLNYRLALLAHPFSDDGAVLKRRRRRSVLPFLISGLWTLVLLNMC
jgi:hypothetical protein